MSETPTPDEIHWLRERRREFALQAAQRLKDLEAKFEPDPTCPLITPYTQFLGIPEEDLRRLYAIRRAPTGADVELPPMPRLRTVIEDTGQPLHLRNYQKAMAAHLAAMPRFVDGDSVGLGKAQPLDAPVLTPTGWRLLGDLQVGDPVVDPDGGESRVTGVFPQGDKESLEVTFSDGSTTECCEEHLWTVQTVRDRGKSSFRTLTLREMLDQGLADVSRGRWRRNRFFLPQIVPVAFDPLAEPLPIPPYALGVLLGDGCIRYNISVSNPSGEVLAGFAAHLPDGAVMRPKSGCDWVVSGCPSWLRALEACGLRGAYSYTKHVPEPYLYASPEERTALLQGLMDTDGECSKEGLAYYHTTSPELRNAVVALTRSLGGVATVSAERRKTYTHNGEKRRGRPSWAVTVKTPFNPFLFREERGNRWKPQMLARAFISVRPMGRKPMQCISVSSQRQLYITKDFVPTHNTLCAIAAACAVDHQLGGGIKVIVLTTNATAYQWETEIKRFSTLNPWVLRDAYKFKGDRKITYGHEARMAQLQKFLEHPKLDVMVCRYSQWMGRRRAATAAFDRDGRPVNQNTGKEVLSDEARDFRDALAGKKQQLVLVLDETHKIKNPDGLLRNVVMAIQRRCGRVWGLTATAIKNNLEEFYAIFSALGVSPLGSLPHFRENFCEWQAMNFAGRTDYKIIGYTRIPEFKVGMRPWFWGRSQAQVGEPLPKLTTLYHPVELSKEQAKLLLEDIPSGAYVLPPAMKVVAGEVELVERDPSNLMAQPLDARILTPGGWVRMGDLCVGDAVVDPDGGEAVIDGISSQRLQKVYRVTTCDRVSTECSEDHLWLLQSHDDRYGNHGSRDRWKALPLTDVLATGVTRPNTTGRRSLYFLPSVHPVEFLPGPPLPIPPYTLGALLGDGSLTTTVKIASVDQGILDRVASELPEGMTLSSYTNIDRRGKAGCYHNLSSAYRKGLPRTSTRNPYIRAAKALGIYGVTTPHKAVPEAYLRASVGDRLDVLRGLMDTDGCAHEGLATFGNTSYQLCCDVAELVRSLGGTAQIRDHKVARGRSVHCWAVDVRMSVCPFHLSRKARVWRPSKSVACLASVDYIGEKVCQCIHVTSKRHTYLTDNYIPTHNTALSVMAAVTNSPALLDVHDPATFLSSKLSPKEELLLDLLDGDYKGESIICFTKYKSWINRLQHLTEKRKFTSRPLLRITGDERGVTREKNRKLFQDPTNDYTLIAINSAGIEGMNLQQAAHLIALDLPWSWGDLIQLVGRMVRMASPHSACTFHILYGLGTIDEYVIETQRGKKGVFERILGSAGTAGLLDAEDLSQDLDNAALGLESESDDNFRDMLRAHAKRVGIRPFVFGSQLAIRQMATGPAPKSGTRGPAQATEQDLDAVW